MISWSQQRQPDGQIPEREFTIAPPKTLRPWNRSIIVEGARQHNLRISRWNFPWPALCSKRRESVRQDHLVKQILYPALQKIKGEQADKLACTSHKVYRLASRSKLVDQNPIGKSSRSIPSLILKHMTRSGTCIPDNREQNAGIQPSIFLQCRRRSLRTCKGREQVVEMRSGRCAPYLWVMRRKKI